MFTAEGQYGLLQVFVIPKVSPKTANVLSYQVKPLSLHYRVNEEDLGSPLAEIEKFELFLRNVTSRRPINEMVMTGSFTFGEIHAWVCLCLPDLSER